ncbi:MAG: mechanosensitive ion channel family protein [Chloroflexi bacterium]|nr:mechanosensitive ion channel family protein [Chloroflexota bacterium]
MLAAFDWETALLSAGERVLYLLAIGALAWASYVLLRRLLPRMLRAALVREPQRADADTLQRYETVISVVLATAETLLVGTAILMALQAMGFPIIPMVAGLSVAGIALGLGTQNLVRDVVSGLFILAEDQYRKGDTVQIGALRGTVEDVTLRRTVLRDADGTVHSIPNGQIAISSNFTREWARVTLDLRLRYSVDLARAQAVINGVGQELAADPDLGPALIEAPRWEQIVTLEESSLLVRIAAVVRPRRQAEVAGELRRRLLDALLTEGIIGPGPAPGTAG